MTVSLEDFSSISHLIDEREAAKVLGCSVAALRKWRTLGNGPAYIKVGRLVRYSEADLATYLDANRKQPVAAGGAQ
jgi:predicted DNA-binding transcriptional regulator AlpA